MSRKLRPSPEDLLFHAQFEPLLPFFPSDRKERRDASISKGKQHRGFLVVRN